MRVHSYDLKALPILRIGWWILQPLSVRKEATISGGGPTTNKIADRLIRRHALALVMDDSASAYPTAVDLSAGLLQLGFPRSACGLWADESFTQATLKDSQADIVADNDTRDTRTVDRSVVMDGESGLAPSGGWVGRTTTGANHKRGEKWSATPAVIRGNHCQVV